MIKNAKSLIDKLKNKAVQNNITVNEVLQNYMFERILERLSISEYKNNFILKGGVLLSSIMGIDTRTTMDMDTCLRGINLTEEQLYKVLIEYLLGISEYYPFVDVYNFSELEKIKEQEDNNDNNTEIESQDIKAIAKIP